MFINRCFFKMDASFKTSVKARKLSGSTVMLDNHGCRYHINISFYNINSYVK